MKFSLLSLTILLNIIFLVSASEFSESATEPIDVSASESSERTTEPIDDPKKRDCPDDQSSFTEDDLYVITSHVANVKFNVLPNITAAYYNLVISASDEMLKEFNQFKKKTEEYPNVLVDVLDNMADTREKKIVPLVKVAAASLQEFPEVRADFDVIYDKATTMLKNLAKYKKICDLNNCSPSIQLRMASDSLEESYRGYTCSTIEVVEKTMIDRLLSFELNIIDRIGNYLYYNDAYLSEGLSSLGKSLRKAVQNKFGVTMYDIVSLDGDYFNFMKSLLDFNSKSYTSALKKNSVAIQYQLLDLNDKIEKYRQHCLECGQVQRRMGVSVDSINILDTIIDAKINEIRYIVYNNISDIYKELNDIVHDEKYIEKILNFLEPVKDDLKKRLEVEEHALEILVESVPQWGRQRVQDVYHKSEVLLRDIHEALDFLKSY